MSPMPPRSPLKLRSVFISDVHLGFKGCRAGYLLDFLRQVECEQLYLVGDIIDLWSLERTFHWPQQPNDVIRTLLGKAKHGTRVVYIPGNHDRVFRDYDDWILGNVQVRVEAIHETADGRRLLVLHGDEFDSVIRASPILESVGNRAYAFVLRLNRHVNNVRARLGYPHCNDGDWVENCTALVEDAEGRISLLRWTEEVSVLTGAMPPSSVALEQAA